MSLKVKLCLPLKRVSPSRRVMKTVEPAGTLLFCWSGVAITNAISLRKKQKLHQCITILRCLSNHNPQEIYPRGSDPDLCSGLSLSPSPLFKNFPCGSYVGTGTCVRGKSTDLLTHKFPDFFTETDKFFSLPVVFSNTLNFFELAGKYYLSC